MYSPYAPDNQYQTIHNSLLEKMIQELMNGNLKIMLGKIEDIHKNIILMRKNSNIYEKIKTNFQTKHCKYQEKCKYLLEQNCWYKHTFDEPDSPKRGEEVTIPYSDKVKARYENIT